MKSVRRVSVCFFALLAFTAACAPPPAPTGPAWSRFQWQRSTSATTTTDRTGAWTDGTWFATIRRTTTSGGTTHKLEVSQRSASNPLALSAAQLLPLNTVADSYGPKIFGESFIAVQQGEIISFFRPSASGVWAVLGEMTVPPGLLLDGLTDSWMVLRRPGYIGAPNGEVNVYAVNATGATIATSLETTLTAPPTLQGTCAGAGFGNTGTRIDGDLLAIGTGNCGLNPSELRAVSVLRHLGGSWQFVQTLRAPAGSGLVGYAKSFDVDDGPTVDRIVVGSSLTTYPYGSSPEAKVEVLEDTGSGFSLAQTLLPDPALNPDLTFPFGSLVTISGRVLGIVTRIAVVPTSTGGSVNSFGYYVGGYTQSPAGTWTREAEKAIFSNPEAAGTSYVMPTAIQAERDTIAVLGMSALSPAPGCSGLCPTDGWRAWFLDRTP